MRRRSLLGLRLLLIGRPFGRVKYVPDAIVVLLLVAAVCFLLLGP